MSFKRCILLAIMAMMGWCYRAQSSTNAEVAPKHVRDGVMAADLFYLSHLRSCAASTIGKHHTGSGATPSLSISGARVVVHFVRGVLTLVLMPVIFVMVGLRSLPLLMVRTTLWFCWCPWRPP